MTFRENNKRVLVLGAGRGQVGLYRAVRNLGHTSIAASVEGNYPGFLYADEILYVDISDPDRVMSAVRKLGIDAVVTSCMDTGMQTLGRVVDELCLVGPSESDARLCFDKIALKEALVKGNVPTADFEVVFALEDLRDAAKRYGYPLVLKKARSQGSDGVFVCHTLETASDRCYSILEEDGRCLVEKYLDGIEFGAQALVFHGEVLFVEPHGDIMTKGINPKPYIHYYPLECSDGLRQSIPLIAKRAINACGLDNCAVNIDFRTDCGKLCIVELTGRAGANGLPELTSAIIGSDYYETIVRIALGETVRVNTRRPRDVLAVEMVYADGFSVGGYELLPCAAPQCFSCVSFVSSRNNINSRQCVGQIAARGKSLSECLDFIAKEKPSLYLD